MYFREGFRKMTDTNTQAVIYQDTEKHNKMSQMPAIMKGEAGQTDYVAHLSRADILRMIETAKTITPGRRGQRNSLLIRTLFDSCLRISECLSLRPTDIKPDGEFYLIQVLGKGRNKGKVSVCAVSPQTVAQLNSYCYEYNISKTDLIFDISRSQAFRQIEAIYQASGVRQPSTLRDHTGAIHCIRHSGAIYRLSLSGNPRSCQEQLRHRSAGMTLRYLKTISHLESMEIEKKLDIWQ
jgi:integrase/recombinase XerD